ncbi:MAG: hypothetical protein L6Q99_06475 [Planctomycetes bacterium]|nr:hypothetical protein [Planctomycetota bacterium]
MPETPFGPAALLQGVDSNGPSYDLYVPSVGVFAQQTWSPPTLAFVAPVGSGTVGVTHALAPRDQQGPRYGTGRNEKGVGFVEFKAPCNATFKQCFTKTITWKGTQPAAGTCAGPYTSIGNGGGPTTTDGNTVYCDAPVGSGDHPGVMRNSDGATSVFDAPNLVNADGLAAQIEAGLPAGMNVTEVTMD